MKSKDLVDLISKKLFRIEGLETRINMDSDSSNFPCPYKDECKVVFGEQNDKKTEPIYSPIFDVDGCDIMLIAEAPSSSGGNGLIFSGSINQYMDSKQIDPFINILKFFKINFPHKKLYFTDIAKCGLASQSDKRVLKPRIKNCAKYMLLEEINLLKPNEIYCIGQASYEHLKKSFKQELNKQGYDFGKNIKKLLHFGRQANMQLNDEDKESIIWKIQCGLIKLEEEPQILTKLSFFREYLNE